MDYFGRSCIIETIRKLHVSGKEKYLPEVYCVRGM